MKLKKEHRAADMPGQTRIMLKPHGTVRHLAVPYTHLTAADE